MLPAKLGEWRRMRQWGKGARPSPTFSPPKPVGDPVRGMCDLSHKAKEVMPHLFFDFIFLVFYFTKIYKDFSR